MPFYSSLSISSSCRLYSAGKHRTSRYSVFLCFPTPRNACCAGYAPQPASLLCPRARASLISKEGQTGLGRNRTKMAEIADRSTHHDLTTRNRSHSLISQNTSLYICAGVYIKTFVKFLSAGSGSVISGSREIRFPRIVFLESVHF